MQRRRTILDVDADDDECALYGEAQEQVLVLLCLHDGCLLVE